jgi:hypothetical protein
MLLVSRRLGFAVGRRDDDVILVSESFLTGLLLLCSPPDSIVSYLQQGLRVLLHVPVAYISFAGRRTPAAEVDADAEGVVCDGTPTKTSLGLPLPGVARNLAISAAVPSSDTRLCISTGRGSARVGGGIGGVVGRAIAGSRALFEADSAKKDEGCDNVPELPGASGS